ncbi:arsenical pump-driving ATPase [Salinimicrobium tongyeongense]|uniref:arsenite-transporting ATPase n=1 Tax=Salinimicrobium tongyeongense TaxID=2809707 RepID=A0ABY6NMP8_9FLAO|nr:arsenical pump-driving ATPase [Salinimicrobium tongyeongense]UZH54162.1 arsenical pump-driving ATPase [Salinimicrobium tongyeongense]
MKDHQTKYLFFTGKGGVGKTSLSCATAIKLADEGKKVLLVSTDPASNLQDVLQSEVYDKINPVDGVANLSAINIDPEVSAEEYRSRVTEPLKQILNEADIQKMNEELSGACTTEIAAFDEFSRFISGESEGGEFDVVVFDTAPTGHTLRLLELPAAWASFTEENPDGASCLGPTSALKSSQERYNTVVKRLRDPELATFYLVARADKSSLKEASRTSDELAELAMKNQELLVNGVFKAVDIQDDFALKMQELAEKELESIPKNLQKLSIKTYPLLPYNILGVEKLRSLLDPELQKKLVISEVKVAKETDRLLPGMDKLVDELTADKTHGLIMTMGKGGVGKTLTASTLAVMIAKRGFEVHLTTTDPAAHVQDFMDQLEELPENLSIDRIDPKLETQRYTEKILSQKGENLDEHGKKLLLEDLKSPCTEEVAVFHAFSKAIQQAKRKFVVIDTAPTGHTLLLLDTAGSYHREVLRTTGMDPAKIRTPYMSLQDPELSKLILVTLPETTPMREASVLQDDLKRAGIDTYAWVVNQSLSMEKGLQDPLLKSRALAEKDVIQTIQKDLSKRTYGIPFIPEEKLLPALLKSLDNIKPVTTI